MRAYRITVPKPDEDLATALLWEAGTQGIEVLAAQEGTAACLLAYFPDEADPTPHLAKLPEARIQATPVPDVDWIARFREGFRAFRVGVFRVVPAWKPPVEGVPCLRVDPGRAFGTGTHETTRLCLRALQRLARERPLGRVLDLGAGSGILAIAAVRLGAAFAVASDLDPEAVDAACHHARLNAARLRLVRGDGGRPFRPGVFDLFLANLTASLLLERRGEIAALASKHGVLVLTGFLAADTGSVDDAYRTSGRTAPLRDGAWGALLVRGAPA